MAHTLPMNNKFSYR